MQHLLCVSHLSVFLPYAQKIWGGTSIQLLTPMKSIRMYQVDFYLRSCWIGGTSLHQPPGISPISPHGPFWMFPKIVVSQNGWFIVEILIKMDDLRVPLFWKHPSSHDPQKPPPRKSPTRGEGRWDPARRALQLLGGRS